MAVNLLESSKIALGQNKVLEATVMELYAKNSDVMAALPMETIDGNAYSFNREKVLPRSDFRGVNEAYTEGTGEMENVTETLAIAGGDLDVDVFIVNTAGEDQRAIQEGMKIKSISLKLTKTFIKGSKASDTKSFDGLQVRLTGSNVKIAAGSTASGDALSLVKLDELIDAVEEPTHLIMNKTMRRRLSAASRSSSVGGYITYAQDAFGRRVTQYNDLPILVVDKDETNTDIMSFDEAASTGTGTVATSIYCVSFADNGVVGLQNGDMDVRDLGEIDSEPVYRTRVEWYITIALKRPLCAARLYGITNAAVTA